MPDKHGTLTAAEFKANLDKRVRRREQLRTAIRHVTQRIKRTRKALLKAQQREAAKTGPGHAVKWAFCKVGTTESPPYSNRGPEIDVWERFTGYTPPVFWCGCFAAYAVVKIGKAAIPNVNRLGFHLNIASDARAGANGLTAVSPSKAKGGDIVTYNFAHIGVIVGPTKDGMVHTIEGNTSSSTGSQNNGGGVFERHRPVSDVLQVARPAY